MDGQTEAITISPTLFLKSVEITRAGVCKTLCPQLPNSNTASPTLLAHDANNSTNIQDFNVILSKGK